MNNIVETLGKALTPSDLAKILNCEVRFVRRHFVELGGVKLGPKKIVFFEKEIERAIQAQRRESEKTLGWAINSEWQNETGCFRYKEGSADMGKRPGKIMSLIDTHNIFG